MFTLRLPKGTALLYDSSYKLPEARRIDYAYYSLIHAAIGSTTEDVDRHFETMLALTQTDDIQAQMNALNNSRYLLFGLMHKQIAPNILALCCLVESVDGQPWDDCSPDGVEVLALKLSEMGICQEHAEAIKPLYEKIIKPLQQEFPMHFPDTQTEAEERIQRALLVQIDEIVQPDDPSLESRRKGVERDFLESIKPPLMNGRGNVPDAIRNAYRKNKFLLLTEGLPVDDQTPSFTFWSYITELQSKYRRQSKSKLD
ncbi:hypothetical protein [Spirosoma gilvum]